MSTDIVVVNVTQQQAPAPNALQKAGAFVSQGGTSTAPGTLTLLSNSQSLQAVAAQPIGITSLAWSAGTVTVTTSSPHGWTNGSVIPIVIAGAVPLGYNGSFSGTVTGVNTVTYPLASNPGTETSPGTINLASVGELQQMNTTFFAQGSGQAVYVLELGESTVDLGVAALVQWMTNNPKVIYSYLIPREWDGNAAFLDMLENYDTTISLTYFFVTTTVANRSLYDGHKCVLAQVESPVVAATEFSLASTFYVTLNYSPNSTNKVTPLSFAFVYGVTAYPIPGNQPIFAELDANNVGWIGTGAEGGISNTIIFYGQLSDGNPFGYWYAADWANLNLNLNLSNEVINGSNNPLAPLYYDQPGINRLQNRAYQTLATAISNGLGTGQLVATQLPAQEFETNFLSNVYEGQIVINAEPFAIYVQENPSDFPIGRYAGLAAIFTPSRGFKQIFFNLNITNIVAA
jgi:hypothetical protein